MPYVLTDLVIDRVDFVDEGANSAAFIEVCKRKEQVESMELSEIISKLKPEHASVVEQHINELNAELTKVRGELDDANKTIAEQNEAIELAKSKEPKECSCDGAAGDDGVCTVCGGVKKNIGFDEAEVLKSMPENLREAYIKMRSQKEAAEEIVRKNAEEKLEAEAVAKAATLKSLPVEQEVLVGIIKNCDPAVVDVLAAAAAAIDNTTLDEVGKSNPNGPDVDAWEKIEAEADKVAKRDSVTKQKAIAIVLKEQPELYKNYLNGGKN